MKLSVVLTTYNHCAYIDEAVEGAVRQECGFPFEIIIGDDFSTDGTREKVQVWAKRFPERIRLILPEQNLGGFGNAIWRLMLRSARGEYIAGLDGDDYWTEQYKLQKQADYLDQHPACAVCFHNVEVRRGDQSGTPARHNIHQPPVSELADILSHNYIAYCSAVWRHRLFPDLPAWFESIANGDWMLHVLNARYGTLNYLDEVMGVYRMHGEGSWSGQAGSERMRQVISALQYAQGELDTQHRARIRATVSYYLYGLAREQWREGQKGAALASLTRAWRKCPLNTLPLRRVGEKVRRRFSR